MTTEKLHCEHFNRDVMHVYVGQTANGERRCSCGGKFVPVGDTFESNDNSYYFDGKGDAPKRRKVRRWD